MEDAERRKEEEGEWLHYKGGWQGKKSFPELSSTNFIILATLLENEIVGVGAGV